MNLHIYIQANGDCNIRYANKSTVLINLFNLIVLDILTLKSILSLFTNEC